MRFKKHRNQILCFGAKSAATEPGSILGSPSFFKKEYLGKFFVAKMKKTLAIISQKLLYSRFRLIGPPVNRVSRLIGPNC